MKRRTTRATVVAVLCACCAGIDAVQQHEFRALVEPVAVQNVSRNSPPSVPFIIWGGDMAMLYANGGLRTKPGTIFAQQGLDLQLEPGDDFIQQVCDYMSGETPFPHGMFRMIGMASGAEIKLLQVLVMKQISTVCGVPIEMVKHSLG